MTDKQIIIDGVDVSECEHVCASTSLFKEKTYVKCSAFFLENSDSYCDCTDNPDCYFKQLKRKEQECFQLANVYHCLIKIANHRLNKIEYLQQQLDQLKVENEELKKKIKYMEEYIKTVENSRNEFEKESKFLKEEIQKL